MEYSDDRGLYRMNLWGIDDGYKVLSLPSCIQGKNSIQKVFDPQVFEDARLFMKLSTYLSENNRMYHYSFRNTTCVKDGSCEFPDPHPYFDTHIIIRMFKNVAKRTVKMSIGLFVIIYTVKLIGMGLKKVFKPTQKK